jgi:hypothetical protein
VSTWFLIDLSSQEPTDFLGSEVQLIQIGDGPYLALAASIAYGVSLLIQRRSLRSRVISVTGQGTETKPS